MTPREALLPNERYCKRCAGEGRVPYEEPYVSSTATEPRFTGMIDCPADCANGIVISESRDASRPGGDIAAEFARLRSAITLARVTIEQQQDHINALLVENRRYREAIDKAARVICSRNFNRTKGDDHAPTN